MEPLVIHHANCWDGFCAAWIVSSRFGGHIEAMPMQYGAPPPDVSGRDVIIVDFSFPRPVLLEMHAKAVRLLVLDHHKTAAADLAGLPFCTFDMEKSGGRLAWEHFYPTIDRSPWLVDYTEDHDLWRHRLLFSREINAGLRSHPLDFALWSSIHADDTYPERLRVDGEAILRRERQIVTDHVRNAREVEVAGHRVLCVNATVLFSDIAGELAKGRPFGAVYFDRADGQQQWSLRSEEQGVDVSVIAKSFGGGGHAHAAGFEQQLV